MRHLTPSLSPFLLGLALLLLPLVGLVQTATAQTPTFNADDPIQSLRTAETSSDQKLIELATALMKARADTKISRSTYQEGVLYFQHNHSEFYGNFFGDPLYATYDARYLQLFRERQRVEPEINPKNSFLSNTGFLCNPLTYDPAFEGQCWGFQFAATDFFFLPSGQFALSSLPSTISPSNSKPRSESRHIVADDLRDRRQDSFERAPVRVPDTLTTSEHAPESSDPAVAAKQIHVPDDVSSRLQKRASSLRQIEVQLRIQQAITKYGEHHTLTPLERAKLASRFADQVYSPDAKGPELEGDLSSQIRSRLNNFEDQRSAPERTTSRSERPNTRTLPNIDPSEIDLPNADDSGSSGESNVDRSDSQRSSKPKKPKESGGR